MENKTELIRFTEKIGRNTAINEAFSRGFKKTAGIGLVIEGKNKPNNHWKYSESDVYAVIADQAPEILSDIYASPKNIIKKNQLRRYYNKLKKINNFSQYYQPEVTKNSFSLFKDSIKNLLQDRDIKEYRAHIF